MVQVRSRPLLVTECIDIEAWLKNAHKQDNDLLHKACVLAQTGETFANAYGQSCLHQGLSMAEQLLDLDVDDETLAASVIYPGIQATDLTLTDVGEHLGDGVAKLIAATQKLDVIQNLRRNRKQALAPKTIDNIRKMLLAIVNDMRVVFIKLAEQLCLLHHADHLNASFRKQLAHETQDFYAPLANRLGIGHLKWQLEDLAFRNLNRNKYRAISRALNSTRLEREQYVADMIKTLHALIEADDIQKASITGRAKHIYSIYKKMQRKGVDFAEIYDVIALRVLVPKIEDCYAILSKVHRQWQYIPHEFDDYISTPKPNGYRSIHTAIIGPQGRNVEIQIRTFDMHNEAELGVAAHWMYKEGRQQTADYEAKIASLRQLLDWQKDLTQAGTQDADTYEQILSDRVYVFTPNGDVIDLIAGSTPLDFAYHIHSEVGHRTRGAKVNDKIVPLTYQLKTGEQVEILTTKQGQPSRDWINPQLGYLATPRARAKVLHWFKHRDFDANASAGQLIVDREIKRLRLKNVDFAALTQRLHFQTRDEMLAAIGRGDIKVGALVSALNDLVKVIAPEPTVAPKAPKKRARPSTTGVSIHGVGNLMTQMANCCNPIPGDDIIGYVTLGRGVSVHRRDCRNVLNLSSDRQQRLIAVDWGNESQARYPVEIVIDAYDRHGLVRDITQLLSTEKIPILSLNCSNDKAGNLAKIFLKVEIESLMPLSTLLARLNQIPNVFAAKRAS